MIANEIHLLQPKTVIDLGIGMGLYGVVTRQILDGIYGRCRPDQWQARICGVEIFEPYRNPCWDLYDVVDVSDFQELPIEGWDLVLMIDALEHLPQPEGDALLARLVAQNKQVIISVPVEPMPQGAAFGNEHEAHLRQFSGSEFDRYRTKRLHRSNVLTVSIKGQG